MDWWESFDTVVRTKIRDDARLAQLWQHHDQNRTHSDLASRGQVAASAHPDVALFEAMLYQRGHIDAFKAVAAPPLRSLPSKPMPRRIKILDIGCGVGTVLFAFDEMLGAKARIEYVGFDHHGPTRRLFNEMMAATTLRLGTTATVEANMTAACVAAAKWGDADLVFVTCSYVLCQGSMTDAIVQRIFNAITQLVDLHGTVRVVIADANMPGRVGMMCDLLSSKLTVQSSWPVDTKQMPYVLKFPDLNGTTFRQQHDRNVEGRYLLVSR